ncbi:MAG: helix-turn-helix transcriptional regulator [Rubrivivax sp.]|nr:helix-turn-helix transcriptional regulator [Rubrivivax sp.]
MTLTERRILFDGPWLQIGHVAVRPTSSACGEIEVASHNVLALPLAGVFAKHDGPRRQVFATPQHALLIPAGQPYRLSFPGCIGDRCLVLRLGDEALERMFAELTGGRGLAATDFAMHLPLPPALVLARGHLWQRLARGPAEVLEVEELGHHLLAGVLRAARRHRLGAAGTGSRRAAPADASGRRLRHVRQAVELIAAQPQARWTLDELAGRANISVSHLAHSFRAELGLSVYDHVLRSRLALALDAVLDSNAGLTDIALAAGFSSHSHFTARFRALFGHTPAQLRRGVHRRTARQVQAMGARIRAVPARPPPGEGPAPVCIGS